VPHYLPGRRYILFLQSLVWPLRTLNDRFVEFAKEKRIEAAMTSQVFYFEWYLNRKFGKYLADPSQKIYISESSPIGVDLYHENAGYSVPFTVWYENEQIITADEQEQPRLMRLVAEEKAVNRASFTVCVPAIAITEYEFVYLLSHTVNTYRIAGKSYLIKIDSKEITPNGRTA
jgi:hypothetical protein